MCPAISYWSLQSCAHTSATTDQSIVYYFICKQTFKYLAALVKEGITQKLIHFNNILGYLPMHYNSILLFRQLYYKLTVRFIHWSLGLIYQYPHAHNALFTFWNSQRESMPRQYNRKRQGPKWNPEDLKAALEQIKSNGTTISAAAAPFWHPKDHSACTPARFSTESWCRKNDYPHTKEGKGDCCQSPSSARNGLSSNS